MGTYVRVRTGKHTYATGGSAVVYLAIGYFWKACAWVLKGSWLLLFWTFKLTVLFVGLCAGLVRTVRHRRKAPEGVEPV